MKLLSSIPFLVLVSFATYGQIDSLGLDNDSVLSTAESNFLNEQFLAQRGQFDFHNKKVVFVTGSTGTTGMTKQEYFVSVKRWRESGSHIATSVYILSEDEQANSGYDAIITAWVKVLTEKSKKKALGLSSTRKR